MLVDTLTVGRVFDRKTECESFRVLQAASAQSGYSLLSFICPCQMSIDFQIIYLLDPEAAKKLAPECCLQKAGCTHKGEIKNYNPCDHCFCKNCIQK